MEPEAAATPETSGDALKRYDIVIRYLGTEAQIFWNRSQLLLVANAAFIGFVFREIPTSLSQIALTKLVVLLIGTITGILLCGLWLRAIKAGSKWLDHWISILKTWEQAAVGDTHLFRSPPKGPSSRGVAKLAAWFFLFIWSALALFTAACLWMKIHCIELP
jgi:hypothetical protein